MVTGNVWCLLVISFTFTEMYSVKRISVPEEHHLYLRCNNSANVIWTHQDKKVIATKQGDYETTQNHNKYSLLYDGSLCVADLERSDCGEYRCNDMLVAEVEVLKGSDFAVSAGRTLLLPCKASSKSKQRWFHRKEGHLRREPIFTRFRNGTVRREREDPQNRFTFDHSALQILNLQPGDAGEYLCNGEIEAKVTVLSAHPDQTSTQTITSTSAMKTDVVERKKKENRPENALVMVAVAGLGAVIVLSGVLCILLTSSKCRRKKKFRNTEQRQEDTELQPWRLSSGPVETEVFQRPSPVEEMEVHYASLGRQNWRERPRVQTDQSHHHHVIYSAVVIRPVGK